MRNRQAEWRSVATSPSIGGATTDSKLASGAPDVLPLLPRDTLENTLRRLPPQAMRRILRHGVVPVAWRPDDLLYAACGTKGRDFAGRHGLPVVAHIASPDFHHCVRRVWGGKILRRATRGLLTTRPQFSARQRLTQRQLAVFLALMVCLALAFAHLPAKAIWAAASAVAGVFFLSVIALRLISLFPVAPAKVKSLEPLNDAQLPTYSVLVPVFRETAVLVQLLRGLSRLNYPALCIKRTKIICPV